MSFGGSAAAMVQSSRYNLAQKRSNRYGKKGKSIGGTIKKTEYNFAKVSNVELDEVKKKDSRAIKIKE